MLSYEPYPFSEPFDYDVNRIVPTVRSLDDVVDALDHLSSLTPTCDWERFDAWCAHRDGRVAERLADLVDTALADYERFASHARDDSFELQWARFGQRWQSGGEQPGRTQMGSGPQRRPQPQPGVPHGVLALARAMARDVSVFSYLTARVVAALANLLTVKLLIDFVVKEDYGRWGVLTSATGMLVPVLTLTLPAAMMRMFFDLNRDDRAGQARLITTTFYLSLVGAAVLVIGALASGAVGLISLATTVYLVAGTSGALVYRFLNYLTRLRDDRRMYFLNEVADRVGFMAVLAAANTGAGAWLLAPFHGNRLLAAAVFFGVSRWPST